MMELTTFAIAVLGAVLGVINTWDQLQKNKVRLRVVPKQVIPLGGSDPRIRFCIDVVNLSDFAVTIDDVGVLYHGTSERCCFVTPLLLDGKPWPRRLEPRSSVTIYGPPPFGTPERRPKCVYAKTECGVTRTGTSQAFRQIANTDA